MASNSNFEPYAYLYDNGFFNPIEVIVDDNKHQEISYCHNNTDVYPRNTLSKKEKILGFLWDNKDDILFSSFSVVVKIGKEAYSSEFIPG